MTSMGGTDLFGWMERTISTVQEPSSSSRWPSTMPAWCCPMPAGVQPDVGQWLHKNKKMYRDLAVWMPVFHATGAKLFVQLTAGFGRSFTISPSWRRLHEPVLRAAADPSWTSSVCAAPSASPNRWSDKVPSREMPAEIDRSSSRSPSRRVCSRRQVSTVSRCTPS
ncbi:MAG: hypothetical protein ACLTXI_01300 [Collinsella sp.]